MRLWRNAQHHTQGELGFKGFVIPDFEGTHSTLYINEGLDLEMPGGVEGVSTGRGGFFLATAPPAAAPGGGRGRARRRRGAPGGGRGAPGGMPEERAAAGAGRGAGAGSWRGSRGPAELPMGMLHAIESGHVKESAITAAVGRLPLDRRFGFLDQGTA